MLNMEMSQVQAACLNNFSTSEVKNIIPLSPSLTLL